MMARCWPASVRPLFIDRAAQIGFATQIFWASGIAAERAWIIPALVLPAITLGQIEFGFDEAGRPEACVCWACTSEEVALELMANPSRLLHISEWNEGRQLWITAALGIPGRVAAFVRRLMHGPLGGFDRLRAAHFDKDGRLLRMLDLPNRKAGNIRPDEGFVRMRE